MTVLRAERAAVRSLTVTRFEAEEQPAPVEDTIAVEEPLEIRLLGETLATTMRTPGHDPELVAGWLLSEGIITRRDDLGEVRHCGRLDDPEYGNVVDVVPAPGTVIDPALIEGACRSAFTASACGVCGRRSIDQLLDRATPLDDDTRWPAAALAELTSRLRQSQPVFERTGGLHAAAIAWAPDAPLLVREDVGRHNAVDKVIGRLLLDAALPMKGAALVVSGRTSFEIVHKAVVARVPIVVAVSAPSSLAVETAERAGLTLIGFTRGGSFTAYSGAERVG